MSDDEIQELVKKINVQFGSDFNPSDFKFLVKDEKKKGKKILRCKILTRNTSYYDKKIFIYSGKEIPKIPAEWVGLHFGTIQDDRFIPSIEGAQIIGRTAKTGILNLDKKEAVDVMSGFDIDLSEEKPDGCYILKSGKDILGVGRLEGRKIINLTPKSRRTSRQYRS